MSAPRDFGRHFVIERRVFVERYGGSGITDAPVVQVLGTVAPDPERLGLLVLKVDVLNCDNGERAGYTAHMNDPLKMIGGGYIDHVIEELKHRLRKHLSDKEAGVFT